MADATSEVVWLRNLLHFLGVQMANASMLCNNRAALHIAANPIFHEHTKHIEVNCHFIRKQLLSGVIATRYTSTTEQLADIFTKALAHCRFQYLLSKLDVLNLHTPT
uniref:Reverse transcriptase Ty1/copia-type domain-containing protein n=1 Tax=Opuntia streptacantha TaxID=393608 RepID=A0A7C8ZIW3_OPUST